MARRVLAFLYGSDRPVARMRLRSWLGLGERQLERALTLLERDGYVRLEAGGRLLRVTVTGRQAVQDRKASGYWRSAG